MYSLLLQLSKDLSSTNLILHLQIGQHDHELNIIFKCLDLLLKAEVVSLLDAPSGPGSGNHSNIIPVSESESKLADLQQKMELSENWYIMAELYRFIGQDSYAKECFKKSFKLGCSKSAIRLGLNFGAIPSASNNSSNSKTLLNAYIRFENDVKSLSMRRSDLSNICDLNDQDFTKYSNYKQQILYFIKANNFTLNGNFDEAIVLIKKSIGLSQSDQSDPATPTPEDSSQFFPNQEDDTTGDVTSLQSRKDTLSPTNQAALKKLPAFNFLLLACILYLQSSFTKSLQAISFGIKNFSQDLNILLRFKQFESFIYERLSAKGIEFTKEKSRRNEVQVNLRANNSFLSPGQSRSRGVSCSSDRDRADPHNVHKQDTKQYHNTDLNGIENFILNIHRDHTSTTIRDHSQNRNTESDYILWLEEALQSQQHCLKITKNIVSSYEAQSMANNLLSLNNSRNANFIPNSSNVTINNSNTVTGYPATQQVAHPSSNSPSPFKPALEAVNSIEETHFHTNSVPNTSTIIAPNNAPNTALQQPSEILNNFTKRKNLVTSLKIIDDSIETRTQASHSQSIKANTMINSRSSHKLMSESGYLPNTMTLTNNEAKSSPNDLTKQISVTSHMSQANMANSTLGLGTLGHSATFNRLEDMSVVSSELKRIRNNETIIDYDVSFPQKIMNDSRNFIKKNNSNVSSSVDIENQNLLSEELFKVGVILCKISTYKCQFISTTSSSTSSSSSNPVGPLNGPQNVNDLTSKIHDSIAHLHKIGMSNSPSFNFSASIQENLSGFSNFSNSSSKVQSSSVNGQIFSNLKLLESILLELKKKSQQLRIREGLFFFYLKKF